MRDISEMLGAGKWERLRSNGLQWESRGRGHRVPRSQPGLGRDAGFVRVSVCVALAVYLCGRGTGSSPPRSSSDGLEEASRSIP